MQKPVQIAYRGLGPREDLSDRVRSRVARLERYFQRIVGCKVTLEGPGRHHRTGKHFRVRIELTVPGGRIVVGRNPPLSSAHADPGAALDVAFREARRRLEDHARRHDHRAAGRGQAQPAPTSA